MIIHEIRKPVTNITEINLNSRYIVINIGTKGGVLMYTGVIIVGGLIINSNRKVKALLPFGDELLIHRQIKEMEKVCQEIIIVTNQIHDFLPIIDPKYRIITDYSIGKRPLSALYAAFSLAKNEKLWVVGSDMPFISSDAAQILFDKLSESGSDAVIPIINNQRWPLHSVYHKSCITTINRLIKENQNDINKFFQFMNWKAIEETEFLERNININFPYYFDTDEEYKHALQLAYGDSKEIQEV